jgi:hypothetical protein
LPVICEIPVLPIAPAGEKRTKFAADPRFGVCPNPVYGTKKKVTAVTRIDTYLAFIGVEFNRTLC